LHFDIVDEDHFGGLDLRCIARVTAPSHEYNQ